MQSHLSLVLIPFLLLHFEEALEHGGVAVSADCCVRRIEAAGCNYDGTHHRCHTNNLLEGLKMFH